jgi:hypothetical protein
MLEFGHFNNHCTLPSAVVPRWRGQGVVLCLFPYLPRHPLQRGTTPPTTTYPEWKTSIPVRERFRNPTKT